MYFLCAFCIQIFFVMRKKNSQVTTLHVIHHGCMPMSVWFGVKFTPGNCEFFHRTLIGLSSLDYHSTFILILILLFFYFIMIHERNQAVTAHSLDCWTHLYTSLCTAITCSQHLVHNSRNSFGGRNIWLPCKWFNLLPLWFMHSNCFSSIAIIQKRSFGGLACTPLCSSSCLMNFTNRPIGKNVRLPLPQLLLLLLSETSIITTM